MAIVKMVDQKKIDRINELARKNKAEGLTPEEIKERDALRKEYLANFRKSFRARLENIEVVSPEEYEKRMKEKKDN
ncbi:DUF896 domain-containing protein [Clostridium sp. 2218st1_F5_2218SCRN_220325]|uniref:DUF896 domain-containing protein n=2 Tax=Bacillota TaxID=1239 RepID=UPI002ED66071